MTQPRGARTPCGEACHLMFVRRGVGPAAGALLVSRGGVGRPFLMTSPPPIRGTLLLAVLLSASGSSCRRALLAGPGGVSSPSTFPGCQRPCAETYPVAPAA